MIKQISVHVPALTYSHKKEFSIYADVFVYILSFIVSVLVFCEIQSENRQSCDLL